MQGTSKTRVFLKKIKSFSKKTASFFKKMASFLKNVLIFFATAGTSTSDRLCKIQLKNTVRTLLR